MRLNLDKTNISTKIIKENANILIDFIHPAINASVNKNEFPFFLKLEYVIPAFKKLKTQLRTNKYNKKHF